MVTDYVGQEIKVGDIMFYGVGRGSLAHGLVIDVIEGAVDHRGYNASHKIKVARLSRNQTYEYRVPGDYRTGYFVDHGGWKVKKAQHGNNENSIVLDPMGVVNHEEIHALLRYANEIIAGAKMVGVPTR